MKIYVVTSGSYSDYSISDVFSTKEKAQAYIDAYGGGYNHIEDYELDPEYKTAKPGYARYSVTMDRDGNVSRNTRCTAIGLVDEEDELYWNRWNNVFQCTVEAKSDVHAVKIVNEKRTQYIAEKGMPELKVIR
jgi:hypothetical protein